ncbi:hypothetical protein BKA62DRAFT_124890 [Auriculariales sp. MPI-PUGE-AT-0066]|nr:hypothetical protein BKA62DRAFT_124890 [Auriculariales sp. MPI-PUGE-AT-0066]
MKYIEACLEALRIASEHDTVGKEKKDSLKKLMSELQQELPSHLFQRPASPTVPPQNPPAPHWPENRTIPVSPNPQLHRLPPERRMSAQTVNHVQLHSDRSSAQAGGHSSLHTESSQSELSQPSLYLDAIPLGLRDQMSTGLLSPPQLYRSLHTEHIRLRPNRPEDTTFSSM